MYLVIVLGRLRKLLKWSNGSRGEFPATGSTHYLLWIQVDLSPKKCRKVGRYLVVQHSLAFTRVVPTIDVGVFGLAAAADGCWWLLMAADASSLSLCLSLLWCLFMTLPFPCIILRQSCISRDIKFALFDSLLNIKLVIALMMMMNLLNLWENLCFENCLWPP